MGDTVFLALESGRGREREARERAERERDKRFHSPSNMHAPIHQAMLGYVIKSPFNRASCEGEKAVPDESQWGKRLCQTRPCHASTTYHIPTWCVRNGEAWGSFSEKAVPDEIKSPP